MRLKKKRIELIKQKTRFWSYLTYKTKSDKLVEGSFFYKRKLTMYNFTESTSSKQCSCSIWTEIASGRSSQNNRHNILVRQLYSAKSQPSYFASNTRISFSSRDHHRNNGEIFSQRILLCVRGWQYIHKQIDQRCNTS